MWRNPIFVLVSTTPTKTKNQNKLKWTRSIKKKPTRWDLKDLQKVYKMNTRMGMVCLLDLCTKLLPSSFKITTTCKMSSKSFNGWLEAEEDALHSKLKTLNMEETQKMLVVCNNHHIVTTLLQRRDAHQKCVFHGRHATSRSSMLHTVA